MLKMLRTLGLIAAGLVPVAAYSADSAQDFVAAAIQGNNSEIMLGKLAQEKAASPAIKQYGQMLVSEHSKARDDMEMLAAKINVPRSTDASPEGKLEYEKLSKLSGDAFDKEFIDAMIKDHEKDVAEFEIHAKANHAASMEAQHQLPTLKLHLEAAKSLRSKL
jgi:putative membrane protein